MNMGDYESIVIIGGISKGQGILTVYVIMILFSGRCSSVVEQRFCKPLVVGSSPTIGSSRTQSWPGFIFYAPCTSSALTATGLSAVVSSAPRRSSASPCIEGRTWE